MVPMARVILMISATIWLMQSVFLQVPGIQQIGLLHIIALALLIGPAKFKAPKDDPSTSDQ